MTGSINRRAEQLNLQINELLGLHSAASHRPKLHLICQSSFFLCTNPDIFLSQAIVWVVWMPGAWYTYQISGTRCCPSPQCPHLTMDHPLLPCLTAWVSYNAPIDYVSTKSMAS